MADSSSSADYRRASLLLSQGRYTEAETFFRAAVAGDPDQAEVLGAFSLCLHCLGKTGEGLEVIERAIALEPESAELHAQKALLHAEKERFGRAMRSAEHAIELDPGLPLAHAAKAESLAGEHRWKEAEAAAREALLRDPGHLLAQNVLSHALLLQGKQDENDATLCERLAQDPENPYTHCNVGRAALRRGDHEKAQQHFFETLRLDSTIEEAREGLLDAFRARSVFYRGFLAFSFFVAKFSRKGRMWLVLGILVAYQLLFRTFSVFSPMLGIVLALVYLLFVLWSFVGRGLGTLIILSDRSARQALTPRELREGIFGGGCLVLGLILTGLGLVLGKWELAVFGVATSVCSLPLAVLYRNLHPNGGRLYPALASIAIAGAVFLGMAVVWPTLLPPHTGSIALIAVAIAVAATTWLVNLGCLFETR